MKKLILFGRVFFSIALIGFGIGSLITGNLMMAASFSTPSETPGRLIGVYFSGVVLVVTGLLLILKKKPVVAAVFSATIIFLWALFRNIPEAVAAPGFGGLWTNAFKTLALGGGALIVAASYSNKEDISAGKFSLSPGLMKVLNTSGHFLVAIFLLICGIQHFMFIDFVAGFRAVRNAGLLESLIVSTPQSIPGRA